MMDLLTASREMARVWRLACSWSFLTSKRPLEINQQKKTLLNERHEVKQGVEEMSRLMLFSFLFLCLQRFLTSY